MENVEKRFVGFLQYLNPELEGGTIWVSLDILPVDVAMIIYVVTPSTHTLLGTLWPQTVGQFVPRHVRQAKLPTTCLWQRTT